MSELERERDRKRDRDRERKGVRGGVGEGAAGWGRRDRLETRRHREQAAWRCQMSRTYKGCVIKIKFKIKWRFNVTSKNKK